MTSPKSFNSRRGGDKRSPSQSDSQASSELVRRRGGLIAAPERLTPHPGTGRLTKLLLNVNIQGSLGPVQVVIPPENTVGDLIKAAVEIYEKEMRRPLLKETDPRRLELHYSQFSLESLKIEEKLMSLGSRNFYLCQKPITVTAANSSCSDEANVAATSTFSFTKFMDFLL